MFNDPKRRVLYLDHRGKIHGFRDKSREWAENKHQCLCSSQASVNICALLLKRWVSYCLLVID